MTENRKEAIRELIKQNPSLSGNKTYELAKEKGIGIRKTDFYEVFRETKKLPSPTVEKRERSIPLKYRMPKDFEKITKKGTYGIAEVINKDNDTSYWIKYDNSSSFRKQLDKIKQDYGDDIEIHFHGTKKYTSFIAQEFKDLLSEYKVEI